MNSTFSKLHRLFRLRLTIAGLFVAGVLMAAAQPPASAYTAPNGATYYPTLWTCDMAAHTAAPLFQVQPQPGYSSQYVEVRIYLLDMRTGTGFWSAWTTRLVYRSSGTTGSMTVGLPSMKLPQGGSYRMYTDYQWWNGSNWTSHAGTWDQYEVMFGWRPTAHDRCLT